MDRRRGTELHVITEIVGSRLAEAASGLPSVIVELKNNTSSLKKLLFRQQHKENPYFLRCQFEK
jgi:hypothetical protein